MSTFDLLGDVPPAQRTLMKLFLRRVELTASELDEAVAGLPEDKRISKPELEATINTLLDQGWIGRKEKDGQAIYTVMQQSRF